MPLPASNEAISHDSSTRPPMTDTATTADAHGTRPAAHDSGTADSPGTRDARLEAGNSTPEHVAVPDSASDVEAALDAAPADDSVMSELTAELPLLEDSLLAQIIHFAGNWFDSLTQQIGEVAHALDNLGVAAAWFEATLLDDAARALFLQTAGTLLAVLLVAGAAEWLVRWLLRYPRRLLRQYAQAQLEAQARQEADEVAAISASLHAASGDAHGMIDGEDGHPGPPPDDMRARLNELLAERRKSIAHSALLRRLPFALGDALLALLSLAAFLVVVSLFTHWLAPRYPQVANLLVPITEAYALLRAGMAVTRLLISPASPQLRLLEMQDIHARFLFRWAVIIFTTTALGVTLARVLLMADAGREAATLVSKVTSLITHLSMIYVVIRTRQPMQAFLRGSDTARPHPFRAFVADIWPATAIFFLVAVWIVWALSITDGFVRGLRFGTITASVLIGARLVWILVVGLLDRSFANIGMESSLGASNYHRYHRIFRALLSWIVYAITIIVLLEAWGVPALQWFANGTLGHRIVSAAATIIISVIIALLVWEAISGALNRRIQRWTSTGDVVRATRLRTFLPMIRTVLFVAIAAIVLMTTLHELGINTTPLLAGASIVGIAVGFGSQKLVQDFITGIFLLMENAMQVGDTVTVAGVTGVVEHLSIRTVHLRASDGSLFVVPFSAVSTVNNVNRGLGNARIRINVGMNADIDAIYAALRQISADMRAEPELAPLIKANIDIAGVEKIEEWLISITAQIRTTDQGRARIQRELNRRVLEYFRKQGMPVVQPATDTPTLMLELNNNA